MEKNYTRFTEVEVTGELKAGTIEGTVKAAGISDVDAAVEAESAPTKAEFNALVGVVNGLRALLGASTT